MAVQKRSDWDDLRVFLALARAGGLSGAARALGVNHATIARRVAALERRLGLALVERRARGYVATRDGAALLAAAERMEAAALDIERRAAGRMPGLSGTVRLTTTDLLATHVVAPALAAFRRRHDAVAIELTVDNRRLSLARREADLALRWARPTAGELVARKLADVGYGAYAAPGYRPEGPPDLIGFDDSLAELPEARWLARAFPDGRMALRSNSVAAQLAAARAGAGVAALPHYIAAAMHELHKVPAAVRPPVRELWLIMHRGARAVPRVRAVAEFIAEAVRERLRAAGDD